MFTVKTNKRARPGPTTGAADMTYSTFLEDVAALGVARASIIATQSGVTGPTLAAWLSRITLQPRKLAA